MLGIRKRELMKVKERDCRVSREILSGENAMIKETTEN